ncbi:MAG: LytTR family DNA-binding domain-containing protein [Pseudomonadota bacterium]
MRVLVAEDEPLAARRLTSELERRSGVELVGVFSDGVAASEGIRNHRPDVVLLDIQMPGRTGFEIVDDMDPVDRPIVIFTTAFDRFALKAFKARALDYLLKPVDPTALSDALDRAAKRLSERSAEARAGELTAIISQIRDNGGPDASSDFDSYFWVRSARANVRVDVVDIEAVEAVRDYVSLHTPSRSYLMRSTMAQIESRLDPGVFLRVHRSFIINLNEIQAMTSTASGARLLVTGSGREVKVGRTFAAALSERLEAARLKRAH